MNVALTRAKHLLVVISPYKKQVFKLKGHLFRSKLDPSQRKLVEVETIDGFQGREKDIILFSSVRSGNKIGFLQDYRRMNVALTRAKHLLVVVGKFDTLKNDAKWEMFVDHLKQTNCKVDILLDS